MNATNSINTDTLPNTVGGGRYIAKRNFVSEKPADNFSDELPEIVDANAIDWTKAPMPSMYSKYDNLQVGQGVAKLLPGTCRTIVARLKRLGMNISARKTADGLMAIARLEDGQA